MANSSSEQGFVPTTTHIAWGVIVASFAGFFVYFNVPEQAPDIVQGDPPPPEVLEETVDRAEAWAARQPRLPRPNSDDEADARSFVVEAPDVVKLGWGWSQARAEAIPTVCVEFDETQADNAQESTIKISEVRDSYSLAREMNVSASVSVKTVAYQGSGKASFAKSSNVSSTAVTYLVSAEVLNAANFAGPRSGDTAVRLTPEAAELARTNLEAFQDICGEGYVAARMTGARAYMLASTKTTSRTDRESVRTSVQGSGWGVKVAAAASGSSTSGTENFERQMTFYQQGGNALIDGAGDITTTIPSAGNSEGDDKPTSVTLNVADLPENASEAIARIKKLAQAAALAGKTFEVRVVPYQVLENFPRNYDILAEEAEQDEIVALWGAYATLYADLKMMLEDPDGYAVPIQVCSAEGVPDPKDPTKTNSVETCRLDFEPLAANATAVAMVEHMQDMALIARDRIEDAAERCIDMEEYCTFDVTTLRSPYSIRAGMPVPIPEVDNKAPIAVEAAMDTAVKNLANGYVLPHPWPQKSPIQVAGPKQVSAVSSAWTAVKSAAEDDSDARVPNIAAISADDHLVIQLREPSQGRCIYGARTPGCISNAEIRRWAARTGFATTVVEAPMMVKQQIEACAGVPADSVLVGDGDSGSLPTIWYPPQVNVNQDGTVTCLTDDAEFD